MEIHVGGRSQLRSLSRALRKAARGDLRKRMTKGIREAARPIVADVKASALAIPSKNVRPDARRRIAAAVGLSVRADGVRVVVRTARLGEQEPLPRLLEGPQPFRHPVFGTDKWVSQNAHPWFRPAIERHRSSVRQSVEKVLDDVAAEIERSV